MVGQLIDTPALCQAPIITSHAARESRRIVPPFRRQFAHKRRNPTCPGRKKEEAREPWTYALPQANP
jgi:hypothetical protein